MSKKLWSLSILTAALVVLGGTIFWSSPMGAAATTNPGGPIINPPPPPPPPPVCDNWANMTHTAVWNGNLPVQLATKGVLQGNVGGTFTTSDGRQGLSVKVTGLVSQGNVRGVGDVDFQFDPSRDSGLSTITANQKGALYPATQRMNFHLTLSINDQLYRSLRPATLLSTSVTSTPPPIGTIFELANQVEFESADRPGEVALTLEPGRAAVTTEKPQA